LKKFFQERVREKAGKKAKARLAGGPPTAQRELKKRNAKAAY